MKIAIASDHAGFKLKEMLKSHDIFAAHSLMDFGTDTTDSVDYPDFAQKVSRAVLDGTADRGILICATGIGMSISANRFKGIRAALCHDVTSARLGRSHNDANILCMGSQFIDEAVALDITELFLQTPFEGGRHALRTQKIENC